MFRKLKRMYIRDLSNPKLIGFFTMAEYFERSALYKDLSKLAPKLQGKLLDIGCGEKPYKNLCKNTDEYVGLEIDRNNKYADEFYDGENIPFDDKSFDSIMSNQMIMYVANPDKLLKEMNRIIKIDGMFLVSTPFLGYLTSSNDSVRYSLTGLKNILHENGFKAIECKESANGVEAVFHLINIYFLHFSIKNRYFRKVFSLIFTIPINIVGLVLSKLLPRDNNLYLNNIILAKKNKDIKGK